jgi:hypothetical protein
MVSRNEPERRLITPLPQMAITRPTDEGMVQAAGVQPRGGAHWPRIPHAAASSPLLHAARTAGRHPGPATPIHRFREPSATVRGCEPGHPKSAGGRRIVQTTSVTSADEEVRRPTPDRSSIAPRSRIHLCVAIGTLSIPNTDHLKDASDFLKKQSLGGFTQKVQ